jgi:hypothetical protein
LFVTLEREIARYELEEQIVKVVKVVKVEEVHQNSAQ